MKRCELCKETTVTVKRRYLSSGVERYLCDYCFEKLRLEDPVL